MTNIETKKLRADLNMWADDSPWDSDKEAEYFQYYDINFKNIEVVYIKFYIKPDRSVSARFNGTKIPANGLDFAIASTKGIIIDPDYKNVFDENKAKITQLVNWHF